MTDLKQYIGKRYGHWTVKDSTRQKGRLYFICQCDCGTIKPVCADGVISGRSTNCGCSKKYHTKHAHSKDRLYRIYLGMKQRCNNENSQSYKNYGGRGIQICKEWNEDFMKFFNWAMSHGYSEELTIDRIDVNGNYEPSNCRWLTRAEQLKNTRKTVLITYNGITKCAMDWCKELGLKNNVVIHRVKSGLPVEQVLAKQSYRGKSFEKGV